MSERWSVFWCDRRCADSPHASREAAEQWLRDLEDSARAACQPFYGHYEIRREEASGE